MGEAVIVAGALGAVVGGDAAGAAVRVSVGFGEGVGPGRIWAVDEPGVGDG